MFGLNAFKKGNKYREFDYIPRYYDERKERLDKRMQEIKVDLNHDEKLQHRREMDFRESAKEKWQGEGFEKQNRNSNIRLIVILGLLIMAMVYLFQYIDGFTLLLQNQ